MTFEMQNNPPIFLHNEEWIEFEQDNYWKKINKIQESFLERLDDYNEPKFYAYFNKICQERRG